MTGKQLLKLLSNDGWKLDRIRGSHYIMTKDSRTLVIPMHGNHDVPKGTLNAILKQAGLK